MSGDFIAGLAVAAFVIAMIAGYIRGSEKRDWNSGQCQDCRKPWKFVRSQGGANNWTCWCARSVWFSTGVDER